MKLSLLTTTLLLTGTLYASQHTVSPVQEGKQAIKLLGKTLKSQLKEKLQLDPTGASAIAFCTAEAQSLTKAVNEKLPSHIKVRRTSLHLRNAGNAADQTDVKVMYAFKEAIKNKSETALVMKKVKVGDTIRLYKPLVAGKACLKCHGENIAPEIATAIKAAYPNDNATGLKLGDFRGVIVAEVKEK